MDAQTLINIAFGIAGFFGGWVINSLSRSIIRLEDKIADLPDKYVSKDNYVRDIDDIKTMLGRIFQRLDAMADK